MDNTGSWHLVSRRRGRSADKSRGSTSTTPPDFDWNMVDRRLETWDDPTPRRTPFTLEDLHATCVAAAAKHQFSRTMSPTREERLKRRDEHDRKSLVIALQVYTKKNNLQPSDLEFVEVKQRNLIDEHGKGFLHFNFIVKESDGTHTNFFAELHLDLKDENDVYLCMPLEEKDMHPSEELYQDNRPGHCYGCKERAADLVHPISGGFLGGHMDVGFPFMEFSSDDDDDDDDDD